MEVLELVQVMADYCGRIYFTYKKRMAHCQRSGAIKRKSFILSTVVLHVKEMGAGGVSKGGEGKEGRGGIPIGTAS